MKRDGTSGTNWACAIVMMALLAAPSLKGGTLDPFAYSASNYAAGATATYTFTYTIETAAPNMILYAIFPGGFSCSAIGTPANPDMLSVTVNGTPAAIAGDSEANNQILIVRLANPNAATAGSNIVVTAQGVVNRDTPGTSFFTWIRTATVGGSAIDAPASIPPIVVTDPPPGLSLGSTFEITQEEAALAEPFAAKPKVEALYDNPFGKPNQKAAATVLTKVSKKNPVPLIRAEHKKKLRLFDAKAQKAAEKAGIGVDTWLQQDPPPQQDLPMTLRVAGKQIPDKEQRVRDVNLSVPVINDIVDGGQDAKGNDLLVIIGQWFGTKAPKAWREYRVPGKEEGSFVIKRQAMKVVKPTAENTTFVDSKLKPACMDAASATGESKVIVVVPKAPKGELNRSIVLDNGIGLAIGYDPVE